MESNIWIHLQYVYSMNRFFHGKALLAVNYEGSSQAVQSPVFCTYIPDVYLEPSLYLSLPSYQFKSTSVSQIRHFPKPSHHYN